MDQQHSEIPAYQPPAGQPAPQTNTDSDTTRRTVALWLLIGPTALTIGAIILYAIVNVIFSSTIGAEHGNTVTTAINVILFVIGALASMAWLPGIIIGIVLLATQKKS